MLILPILATSLKHFLFERLECSFWASKAKKDHWITFLRSAAVKFGAGLLLCGGRSISAFLSEKPWQANI